MKQVASLFGLPVIAMDGLPSQVVYLYAQDANGNLLVKESKFESDLAGKHFREFVEMGARPLHFRISNEIGNLESLQSSYGHAGNVSKKDYPERKECKDVARIIKNLQEV